MKKTLLFLLLTLSVQVYAQFVNPVSMKLDKSIDGVNGVLTFTASIESGWHMYSTNIPEGGPTAATFNVDKIEGAELVGELTPGEGWVEVDDPIFEMRLRFFADKATFTQKFKVTAPEYRIEGYLEYGCCNDENCTPPTAFDFNVTGNVEMPAPAKEKPAPAKEKPAPTVAPKQNTPAVESAVVEPAVVEQPAESAVVEPAVVEPAENHNQYISELWTPVIDKLDVKENTANRSLWITFVLGFGGGLLALLTPCVWPIIPMTVSFFLKRSKSRSKALSEAILYGLSIVVIYLTLGLVVTSLFGASALNALSTNAVFNIFFCLLLVVFAASFFGGFEITLPSSWTNKVDEKASNTSGMLSIFLMAFTLALVSFSCTGPIIGFLLVEMATEGSIFGPAIGMFGFALALALPFTFFAIFPSLLKQVPRSGGWMNTVKVVLGFVELAFALKFFSVADLAYGWRLLDREVFLAIWIALFTCLGLYLLNVIRFPHDDLEEKNTSVTKFFLALISLSFAVYMVPGLWGAPCKAVSAFAPPMWTQDFQLIDNTIHPVSYDFDEGMKIAREKGKPALIDFTGHGCVNCREMEAAVWTDDKVRSILNDEFILISLYVDDRTPLDEVIEVEEQGTVRKLRTVGDKWSYLQRYKFGANAQPFYVPVDENANPLNGSYSYNKDVNAYINFLEKAISNYKNNK